MQAVLFFFFSLKHVYMKKTPTLFYHLFIYLFTSQKHAFFTGVCILFISIVHSQRFVLCTHTVKRMQTYLSKVKMGKVNECITFLSVFTNVR